MAEIGLSEAVYAVGAVVRLTGLSDHLLRAWERRYGAVTPLRTAGGSRRYRQADVDRLRLLASAVRSGHLISELARLSDRELEALIAAARPAARAPVEEALAAIEHLDAREIERLLALQFAALGPRGFARDFVQPLLREVGRRWERGELPIVAEHLVSGMIRGILGAALRASSGSAAEAPMLLATPAGERHEFGVLIAALLAVSAGRNPVYLGPDVPAEEIRLAVARTGAAVVVLGLVALAPAAATAEIGRVRAGLPAEVSLWVGGGGTRCLAPQEGIVLLDDLDGFEARAVTLAPGPPRSIAA